MLTKSAIRKQGQRAMPSLEKCERCGATENLQRHYPNMKDAAYVVVLCQKCHAEDHCKTGSWGRGPRKAKTCVICGLEFSDYSHTRVKTCGPNCLSELGRRNAYRRWAPGLTDLEDSEMPSFPNSQSGSEGES